MLTDWFRCWVYLFGGEGSVLNTILSIPQWFCIKMASNESHFNIVPVVRGKLTRWCQQPQFFKGKESQSRELNWHCPCISLMPYLGRTCWRDCQAASHPVSCSICLVWQGRLKPGRMLLVDTKEQVFMKDEVLKANIASLRPVSTWLKEVSSGL